MGMDDRACEWLECGRDGSFALGCVDRKLRRKYHGLLTVREGDAARAWSVLADVIETIHAEGRSTTLSDPRHDVEAGGLAREQRADSGSELLAFTPFPHARHRYRTVGLAQPIEIEREVRIDGRAQVALHYRVSGVTTATQLALAPLLRCRDLHALTFENPFLDGSLLQVESDAALELSMQPYEGTPELAFRLELPSDVRVHMERAGRWWTDLHYPWETARGYAANEHAFEPGAFVIELVRDCEFTLRIGRAPLAPRQQERVECAAPPQLADVLARAVEQFTVRTPRGEQSMIAGFPWFGAVSRQTLLALPGLQLASGDFERSAALLDGLLASRVGGLIADEGRASVDASLLFARAVQWLGAEVGSDLVERFMPAVCESLLALAEGGHPHARFDRGLGIFSQRGAWALTWMDAMADGHPVTARAGYAVELDALAYNAAHFAMRWAERERGSLARSFVRGFRNRLLGAEADFMRRYWSDARGYLADAHDGQQPDPTLRPNQLFALALPYQPVAAGPARSALATVLRELLTPAGLRTLAPWHRAYRGKHGDAADERDRGLHQGAVWPWLLGVCSDALHLHGRAEDRSARLAPVFTFFSEHVSRAGCLGQVSELFSGDAPHAAGGAPAQAWSVAELYRALRGAAPCNSAPANTRTPAH
jgi:glycogen debranching enzyme